MKPKITLNLIAKRILYSTLGIVIFPIIILWDVWVVGGADNSSWKFWE
jgi:hypothetical protein